MMRVPLCLETRFGLGSGRLPAAGKKSQVESEAFSRTAAPENNVLFFCVRRQKNRRPVAPHDLGFTRGKIVHICPTSVRVVCWGIFGWRFTAKHLTMLGLFGVALSKRCAEKKTQFIISDVRNLTSNAES